MDYKTIVLKLLQERPQMQDQLGTKRTLLRTVNAYANYLKGKHKAWKEELSPARSGTSPEQIASEALELALEDLKDTLPAESPTSEDDPLSLDAAMAFIRRTPPE